MRFREGLIWSFVDQSLNMGIVFVTNIILARLLSPDVFGLIGMILIVLAISDTLINSGLSQALIIRKNCTDLDYNTVNIYNSLIALILYIIIFFLSDKIAFFYGYEELSKIVKILSVTIIIDAISIVHRTILIQDVDFKKLSFISLIANTTAALIAIYVALNGGGIWSLVWLKVSRHLLFSILLYVVVPWRPAIKFSIASFKEMFTYGSRLMLSGLIDVFFRNSYYVLIGKYFGATQLGFYSKAEELKALPSTNFSSVIERAFFPAIARLQNGDKIKLVKVYARLTKSMSLAVLFMLSMMVGAGDKIVLYLLGVDWLKVAPYLKLLSIAAIFTPCGLVNMNILKITGDSKLILRLEIVKKILFIPTLWVGFHFGILPMLFVGIFRGFLAFLINAYYAGKKIGYYMTKQIVDIAPSIIMFIINSMLLHYISMNYGSSFLKLVFILFCDTLMFMAILEMIRFEPYRDIRKLIFKT